MGLTVSYSPSSAFKKVPPGVWLARCVGLVDLGTQEVTFSGETKLQHKLQVTWAVVGEDEAGVPLTAEVDGREVPLQISKRYTLSLNEKAGLRRDLIAWRGRDFTPEELKAFDLSKLLGAWCMLNVQHNESPNGKTYANVASITPVPLAMRKSLPEDDTELVSFDLSAFNEHVFAALPEYVQGVIKESAEYKSRSAAPKPTPKAASPKQAEPALADMEDDIPFVLSLNEYAVASSKNRRMSRTVF